MSTARTSHDTFCLSFANKEDVLRAWMENQVSDRSPPPPPPAQTRDDALDGIRAIAVVSVFLFHGGLLSPFVTQHVGQVVAHGDTGVQVFFVLSGFLIYRPFVTAHLLGRPTPGIRSYAIRRVGRIYPAYWLALSVLLILGTVSVVHRPVPYFTLTQTYFRDTSFFAGIAVSWSLVIEVSFYAFVPIWSWVVRRLGRRRPFGAELVGCAVLVGIGLASIAWFYFGNPPTAVRVLPPAFATLGVGMALAALAAQSHVDPELAAALRRLGSPARWWWLAAAAAFAVQCSLPYHFLGLTAEQAVRDQYLRVVVAGCLVVPGVFGSGGVIRRGLRARPVAYVGVVSYGMYLWHTSIIDEVARHDSMSAGLQVFVALVVTVIVASASWYGLERPILRRVHRRSTRGRVAEAGTVTPRPRAIS